MTHRRRCSWRAARIPTDTFPRYRKRSSTTRGLDDWRPDVLSYPDFIPCIFRLRCSQQYPT